MIPSIVSTHTYLFTEYFSYHLIRVENEGRAGGGTDKCSLEKTGRVTVQICCLPSIPGLSSTQRLHQTEELQQSEL